MNESEKNLSSLEDIINKYSLTFRQCEILRLTMLSHSRREIAQKLNISDVTLWREFKNPKLNYAIGDISLMVLDHNQTNARALVDTSLSFLRQLIENDQIPIGEKLKAVKLSLLATETLDKTKLESEVMELWRAQNMPEAIPTESNQEFFEIIE